MKKETACLVGIAVCVLSCLQRAQAQDKLFLECEGVEKYNSPDPSPGYSTTTNEIYVFELSEDRSQVHPLAGHPIFAFNNCHQDDAAVRCSVRNEPEPTAGKTAKKTYSVLFNRFSGAFAISYSVDYPKGTTTWYVLGRCKPRTNKQLF